MRSYFGSDEQESSPQHAERFKDGDTRGWFLGADSGPNRYNTSLSGGGGRRGSGNGGSREVGGVRWSQGGGSSPPVGINPETSLASVMPFVQEILDGTHIFERRPWAEDLKDWDLTIRADAIEHHNALSSQDLPSLSANEMIDYLEACYANSVYGSNIHFGLGSIGLSQAFGTPLNDFLAHVFHWTGGKSAAEPGRVSPRLALDCVAGYSAPSVICTNAEAIAVSRAIMASTSATNILASAGATDDEASSRAIAELEANDSEVVTSFLAFKFLVGYRLTDSHTGIATAPYLLETPATFLRLLRCCIQHVEACDMAGVPASASPVKHVSDAATQRVRAEIAGQHLQLFDMLLDEARSCYKLRDERVNYGDAWANGIVRRAMIECGRRGGLSDPTAAVEATHEQLKELIGGAPSAKTLAELRRLREARHASNIHFLPPRLEGTSLNPPSAADTSAYETVLSWLPPDAAETMRRMHRLNDVRGHLEAFVGTNSPGTALLHGVGISGSVYEGVAVVGVMGIDIDVSSLVPGVILVTQATSSSFNLVCPSLGGLVCDGGSLLSHPAITVREHGLPAVVAAGGCCSCVHTGDRLRIDPDNNLVEIIERAPHSKM